jgi:hypothetical protein
MDYYSPEAGSALTAASSDFHRVFEALRDVKPPFFTTTSGRKDGIVFMILLSGNLDDDTLAAEYTARTTT